MIDFPSSTAIGRKLPKEAFYKNLPLTKAIKDKFVSDIDRFVIENSLTKENLRLSTDSEIKEILILSVFLKKENYDRKTLEAIARNNKHNLVFLLRFQDRVQIAIYYGKLFRSPWATETETALSARGTSLDEIWNAFVEQIALRDERAQNVDNLSMKERVALQDRILRLEKDIEKLEADTWKEKQPKKRFEKFTQLQRWQKELEVLKKSKTTSKFADS